MDGVPKPEKLWYKKLYNETIELPFTENVKIRNFQFNDEGIYVCKAKNQIGVSQEIKYLVTGRADGEFTVYYRCCVEDFFFQLTFRSIFALTCTLVAPNILKSNLSILRVRLGDDIKINCQCHLCMPLIDYDWFFDDHQSDQNTYIEQHLVMGEIGNNSAVITLEIINATASNAGKYTCRLGNVYGNDEMVIMLEVLLPPQIENLSIENPIQLNEKDVVVEGSSSYIKCTVKGQPLPVIHWWKNGEPIIYDGRM